MGEDGSSWSSRPGYVHSSCSSELVSQRVRQSLTLPFFLQAWIVVLALVKLALAFNHRLFALRHPDVPHREMAAFYSTLERHIIPYLVLYSALTGFFDLRSALLDYHSFPYGPARKLVQVEAALFAISSTLAVLEFFAPRPSQFSSRSSGTPMGVTVDGKPLPPTPEVHASLASLATFSYMESFQLRCAFPERYDTGALKLDDIPDLRPDDKTARVLLAYRQSLTHLDAFLARLPLVLRRRLVPDAEGVESLGLTWKLLWHFSPALVAQNLYSLVRVATNGIPPLMLKGILAHIGARNRGENAPVHVAVLYAWVLFLATVVGSVGSSQALFIGRRVCLRLRCVPLLLLSLLGEEQRLTARPPAAQSSSARSSPRRFAARTRPARRPHTTRPARRPTSRRRPRCRPRRLPQSARTRRRPHRASRPRRARTRTPSRSSRPTCRRRRRARSSTSSASTPTAVRPPLPSLCREPVAASETLTRRCRLAVSEISAYLHFLTSEMPLTIVVICWLLWRLLGVGISVLIGIMPITAYISKLYLKYQDELLHAADQRLELTTEVIGQLRIVKFFAWERKFIDKMEIARKKELAAVWRRALAVTVGWNLTFGTPVLVGIVTFVTQTKVLHRPLTAETAFTALALFTVLRGPLEGFTDSASLHLPFSPPCHSGTC